MFNNLVAFSGGLIHLERVTATGRGGIGQPAGPAGEVACCLICGCPAGPCTYGAAADAARPEVECPLLTGRTDRAPVKLPIDPEMAALTMASLFLLGSVFFTAL